MGDSLDSFVKSKIRNNNNLKYLKMKYFDQIKLWPAVADLLNDLHWAKYLLFLFL